VPVSRFVREKEARVNEEKLYLNREKRHGNGRVTEEDACRVVERSPVGEGK